ncbi:hypothetical protein CBS101457_006702 [Exobasidium rhododendri]|nr:hypothetical protein CBS101457_006702 [Exobasidium rhododendri]
MKLLCHTLVVLALAALTLASPLQRRKSAKEFHVNGKHIPGVPFAVEDSYAGLLPITAAQDESREFFFWWYPSESHVGSDDLVIWLNGGPGCSSLEGLLQENGPILFPFNSTAVVRNPYSWTKLSNVLWVEQPVGVGLGKGSPDVHNEIEVGKQFYGFLVEFMKTFPQLRNKKLYITGESYAGKYIPYIADEILTHHTKAENTKNGLNYYGISINDPSFINDGFSEELPAVEFAEHYQKTLGLNNSFIASLRKTAKANGVDNFVAKNLVYPPKGPIFLPEQYDADNYDPFDAIYTAAQAVNPCFNVYNINPIYKCPSIYDPLGFPPDAINPSATNIVNNITGFKEYIHADPSTIWYECTNYQVFVKGEDSSPAPADAGVLSRLIDNSPSGRVIVQHGLLDFILIANGSALGIQNITFGGLQGFQKKPSQELIVKGERKGLVHTERGLTFYEARGSGHMIPQDQPASAFKMLKFLLGQISESDLYN